MNVFLNLSEYPYFLQQMLWPRAIPAFLTGVIIQNCNLLLLSIPHAAQVMHSYDLQDPKTVKSQAIYQQEALERDVSLVGPGTVITF